MDKLMYERNLTIRQVSNMTGITKSTIQRIMNHEVIPKMDTMEQIAMGLTVYMEDLYESCVKKCPSSGTNT